MPPANYIMPTNKLTKLQSSNSDWKVGHQSLSYMTYAEMTSPLNSGLKENPANLTNNALQRAM